MKKPVAKKQLSKFEEINRCTQHDNMHLHSATILARRRVLLFKAEETEKVIVALKAALTTAQEEKQVLAAEVQGLSMVLESRSKAKE